MIALRNDSSACLNESNVSKWKQPFIFFSFFLIIRVDKNGARKILGGKKTLFLPENVLKRGEKPNSSRSNLCSSSTKKSKAR